MSLLVWLPLIKDYNNKGLLNITPTVLGTVSLINGGKIGKCISAGNGSQTSNGISYNTNLVEELGNKFSCAIWVRPLGNHVHYNGTFISSGDWNKSTWSFGVNQDNTKVDVFSKNYNIYINCEVPVNKWTHLACTSNNGLTKLYKNGEYVGEINTSSVLSSDATNFTIGRETYAGGYFSFNGNINDIRIYDHVLSPLEIKEISRGLVCHYKLDDICSTQNLILNGYGELGNDNWSNTNISSTEIPPNQPDIKASFYNNNTTNEYIPIFSHHKYTISAYLKAMPNQSTTMTYPSILPYDIDKNFIYTYNSKEGFNTLTKTVLVQPLKKGDTVVYLEDVSKWSAGNNYYNYIAIFGYKDKRGHVYDDLEYTHDSPAFATTTDKSHIDFTNNTITLNSPFSGEDRPIGTAVCQSTAGATNYYPFGGITLSTITDWTLKSSSFVPALNPRLSAAKYIRFYVYFNVYIAGIKLIDESIMDNKIYDSSGLNNNMNVVGAPTLTTSNRRYLNGFHFKNGQYLISPHSSNSGYLPKDSITVNIWINFSSWGNPISCTEGGGWNFESASAGIQFPLYISGVGYKVANSGIPVSSLLNNWHMLTGTFDGSSVRIYIDGELKKTTETGSTNGIGYSSAALCISAEAQSATAPNNSAMVGDISDVRIYATALSDTDILDLYNIGAKVTKNGELHNYEINENYNVQKPIISKNGVVESSGKGIYENLISGTNKKEFSTSSKVPEDGILCCGSGGNGVFSITEDTVPIGKYSYNITGNTSGNRDFQQHSIPYQNGKKYTGSWWAKGTGSCLYRVWNRTKSSQPMGKTFTLTNEWKFYSHTFTATQEMQDDNCTFHLGITGNGEIHICGMKLEQNDKPTAWVQSEYDSDFCGIQHGFIETNEFGYQNNSAQIYNNYYKSKEFIEM